MKTTSLKIQGVQSVVGKDLYRDYTGDDLCQQHGNAPVGFYSNANKSFKGIVFRDRNGNCTYFDRTHGLIYNFDKDVWFNSTFNFIPEMRSLSIGFPTEKKSKKVVDSIEA